MRPRVRVPSLPPNLRPELVSSSVKTTGSITSALPTNRELLHSWTQAPPQGTFWRVCDSCVGSALLICRDVAPETAQSNAVSRMLAPSMSEPAPAAAVSWEQLKQLHKNWERAAGPAPRYSQPR